MENYFRVTFKAHLVKFALAFKADCHIDIFWKKGQKIAQSSKVPFSNTTALFNEQLSISCNMVYDLQNKTFKEKITKFQIILYTEKGNKKVGEIRFDVSAYLNQRLKSPKEYEVALDKCPDRNAKLIFKLSATVEQKISADTISHSSQKTVNVQTLVDASKSQIQSSIFAPTNSSQIQVPVKDTSSSFKKQTNSINQKKFTTATSIEVAVSKNLEREANSAEKTKDIELENKKMREKLKQKERLLRQNEQLKKKIKNQEYESVKQIKQKIDNGRKQIQKLQSTFKKQILLQKEVKAIQDQIFRCKYQIMNAFNYANEKGGGKLMFQMQQACGLKQM